MTEIRISKTKDVLFMQIQGHAGYGDIGFDIVCASISTASIMSINLLEVLELKDQIQKLIVEDGLIIMELKTHNKTVIGIFENLEYTFKELSRQYQKHIKIIY